jgi:hypothetical protein
MPEQTSTPHTAVWYFIGATFIFAAPTIFFRDADLPWLLVAALVLGFAVFAGGIVVFVREQRQGRAVRDAGTPTDGGGD